MNNSRGDVLALAGRVLLAVIFIQGGYGKLMAMDGSIAYIASTGLPTPPVAYWVSVVVELGGGLAILFGLQTFLTALALALFCLVTAFAVHLQPGNMGQMINFWKNIAIAGGFLQVAAFGPGRLSLDASTGRSRATSPAV
jgi:putative oxidoreductase